MLTPESACARENLNPTQDFLGAVVRNVADDLASVLDIYPTPLVVRYTVENIEPQVCRCLDRTLDKLYCVSLTAPDGAGFGLVRACPRR